MLFRSIETSGKVWIYRPEKHKTAHHGKQRMVLIGPKAKAAIEPFLRTELDAFLFTPAQADRERREARCADYAPPANAAGDYRNWPSYQKRRQQAEAKAEPKRYRDRYTSTTYARAIAEACIAANIPHWSPNRLRHNAATRIRKEYGLDIAQVVLGHSGADVTQVYAEADLAKATKAIEAVG